jgi:hypothetical protein
MRFSLFALALLFSLSCGFSLATASAEEPILVPRIPAGWVDGHFGAFFSISSLLIVLWYAGSWLLCSSDPKPRTPYPIFHIPYGLEPGYIGYIKKLSFEPDLFLADLIDLGVRGFVVISPLENAISVSRTQKTWNGLSRAHMAMMDNLFEGGKPSVILCGMGGVGSDADIASTQKKISLMPSFYGLARRARAQKTDARKLPALVKWNWKPVLFGLPLFIPFFLLMGTLPDISRDVWPIGLAALFFAPFFTAAVRTVKNLKKNAAFKESAGNFREKRHSGQAKGKRHIKTQNGGCAVLASMLMIVTLLAVFSLAIPFFIIRWLLSTLFAGSLAADPGVLTWIGAVIASSLVFSAIMPVRTPEGRKLLARVDGFEIFLKTAEKKRLETLYPFRGQKIPEFTLDLFERFLPYAFALGVAEKWAGAFAEMLAESEYSPRWHGGAFNARSFCAGIRRLGLSINAAPRRRRRERDEQISQTRGRGKDR